MAKSVNQKIEIQAQADKLIAAAQADGNDAGADYQSFMPYNQIESALRHAMQGLISDEAIMLALEDSSIQDKINELTFAAFERAAVIDTLI